MGNIKPIRGPLPLPKGPLYETYGKYYITKGSITYLIPRIKA